jgi:hypothetical protein
MMIKSLLAAVVLVTSLRRARNPGRINRNEPVELSIRSATLSSGRQPRRSSFPVRIANLLSRPDLAAPKPRSATKEMGGAEPPAATRSARLSRASMARLASTGPSPQ